MVAAVQPANGGEALLAVQYVAAALQSAAMQQLAWRFPANEMHVKRCTAAFAVMMRESRAARTLLLRVQAARGKREADPAAKDRGARDGRPRRAADGGRAEPQRTAAGGGACAGAAGRPW